jgi:hypothetical protein
MLNDEIGEKNQLKKKHKKTTQVNWPSLW